MHTVPPLVLYSDLLQATPRRPRTNLQIEIDAIMERERSVVAPPRPRRRSVVRRIVSGLRSA